MTGPCGIMLIGRVGGLNDPGLVSDLLANSGNDGNDGSTGVVARRGLESGDNCVKSTIDIGVIRSTFKFDLFPCLILGGVSGSFDKSMIIGDGLDSGLTDGSRLTVGRGDGSLTLDDLLKEVRWGDGVNGDRSTLTVQDIS